MKYYILFSSVCLFAFFSCSEFETTDEDLKNTNSKLSQFESRSTQFFNGYSYNTEVLLRDTVGLHQQIFVSLPVIDVDTPIVSGNTKTFGINMNVSSDPIFSTDTMEILNPFKAINNLFGGELNITGEEVSFVYEGVSRSIDIPEEFTNNMDSIQMSSSPYVANDTINGMTLSENIQNMINEGYTVNDLGSEYEIIADIGNNLSSYIYVLKSDGKPYYAEIYSNSEKILELDIDDTYGNLKDITGRMFRNNQEIFRNTFSN